jgi:hypothetical protein
VGVLVSVPAGNPDLAAVRRLLDLARRAGFTFPPAGETGSLWGEWVTVRWRGVVFLGASGHCNAAPSQHGRARPG